MTKFLFAWNDQGVLARISNDYSLTTPVWEAIDDGIVGKINDICPDWWSEFYTTGRGSGALGAYAVATQGSLLRIYYSSNILAATVTWTQQTSFNIYKTPPASGGLDTSIETSARIAASKEEEGFVIAAWRTLRANVFTQTVDGGTTWATPTAMGISSSTDLVANTNIGLALSEKLVPDHSQG